MNKKIFTIVGMCIVVLVGSFYLYSRYNTSGSKPCPESGFISVFDITTRCEGYYNLSESSVTFYAEPNGMWELSIQKPETTNATSTEAWVATQPKNAGAENKTGIALIKYVPTNAGVFAVYTTIDAVDGDGKNTVYAPTNRTAVLITNNKKYTLIKNTRLASVEADEAFDAWISGFAL